MPTTSRRASPCPPQPYCTRTFAFAHFIRRRTVNFSFSEWIGEVTTGHGAMIIGPTLLAVSSGTMTWPTAVPFLVAGVVGPALAGEHGAEKRGADRRRGCRGADRGVPVRPERRCGRVMPTTQPRHRRWPRRTVVRRCRRWRCWWRPGWRFPPAPTRRRLSRLRPKRPSLRACCASPMRPARSLRSPPRTISNAMKGVNSAIAAGNVLLTDAACQTAIADGVAALPATSTAKP